jgi:signal transduction histidine kinase
MKGGRLQDRRCIKAAEDQAARMKKKRSQSTSRKRATRHAVVKARNRTEQLQKFTGNLLALQEAENRNLARELHDVYSQELAALSLEISTLLASGEVAHELTERLAGLGKKIGNLAEEMHSASRRIHPAIVHELGLEAALRAECNRFSEQLKIPVKFTCAELPTALPEDVALCLYRIAQESLHNIGRHSGSREARVELLAHGDGITLRVHDSGDGFDVNKARQRGGLGLISMEERVRRVNGKFQIHSHPGVGTTVEAFVPLK